MSLYSPLDLKNIFMLDVAGSAEIFTFFSILLVAFAMAKFSFPSKISLPLFALFGIIMATYLQGLYVIIMLIIGLVVFYTFSKISR